MNKRKDWIKNIAIIFLSIMLVLTFFSNSIMNYSLPEVATAMVEPGTVTAKIRGTGTLTADDPYKVSIQESRVIASVAVKEGDVVEKDQVLFYLEDKESEELKAAEDKLNELVLAYTTELLSGDISQQSYQNIQSGNISGTNTYQNRINEARQKVESAQATVDSLAKQIAITTAGVNDSADKETDLKNAEAAKSQAAEQLTAAQTKLSSAQTELGGFDATQLTDDKLQKEQAEATRQAEYENARQACETAINNQLTTQGKSPITVEDLAKKSNWNEYLGTLSKIIEEIKAGGGADVSAELTAMKSAFEVYRAAKADREKAETELNQKYSLSKQLPQLKSAVSKAQNYYDECSTLVQSLTNEINNNTINANQQKANLDKSKIGADEALKTAENELKQLLTDVSKELGLSNQNNTIREQQKEVERLRDKAQGSTIVAPVAGTVSSITKTAGETTVPDEALVTMLPEGKGYSMSFSVTNDQAKKVSVGDVAELQNSWFYGDVKATLTAIRPDTENPGQKKLLYFNVAGEVQPGQNISLSIGQKSANYDMIVPNSSVREDKNGKFILIVESRNSPLGNRYIATRVDVEVLASDDVNTAINAPLYGYEYVITTSTKPVEAGKQVRLAEN